MPHNKRMDRSGIGRGARFARTHQLPVGHPERYPPNSWGIDCENELSQFLQYCLQFALPVYLPTFILTHHDEYCWQM